MELIFVKIGRAHIVGSIIYRLALAVSHQILNYEWPIFKIRMV